jgi:hypothetical protein
MAQSIRIKRTIVPDNPPPALADGELAVELNSAVPRLWVGVPTGIDRPAHGKSSAMTSICR